PETPVGPPADLPVGEVPVDVPVGKPDDVPPVDIPADIPVDVPVGKPDDVPVGKPDDVPPVDVPVDLPVEAPVTPPTPENPVLPETPVADTPAEPETPATPVKPETPVGPPADIPVGKPASSPTNVDSGVLVLNDHYDNDGSYIIDAGGILKGSGVTDATVTVVAGGILSPGNSPGTLTTASQTWTDGGGFIWEINDSDGTKGGDPGWDSFNIDGTLDLSSLSIGGFTIYITSLDLENNLGEAAGFDEFNLTMGDLTGYYSFVIAETTSGILGFDESLFVLDTSDFLNTDPSWDWAIVQEGNNLFLESSATSGSAFAPLLSQSSTANPEPSSVTLLALGGLALALRRKRS
ncbi:MAG: PEP-CTERM sorting domain-containing protein, partial [Akkermansiaceae bacterium]